MNKQLLSTDPNDIIIPMSSTLCDSCIFAEYDSNNIQIGCKANRLDKFKEANIPLVTIEQPNKTFYAIEGKLCVYYRNKDWFNLQHPNMSNADKLTQVKKELRIPYHAIVFLRQTDTIANLTERLQELEQQEIKPKIVTVVDRSHSIEALTPDLIRLLPTFKFDHWRFMLFG